MQAYQEDTITKHQEGLVEFAAKIKAMPELKTQILEMLRSWLVGQNRNSEYFTLRDVVLPGMLGVNGALFFVEVCQTGGPESLTIPDELQDFLSTCNLGYGRFFAQAEKFSASPLSLTSYNNTYNTVSRTTHISLSRADGVVFTYNINPVSYIEMIQFLISQRTVVEQIHGVSIDFSAVASSLSRQDDEASKETMPKE